MLQSDTNKTNSISQLPFTVQPGASLLLPLLFRASAVGERRLHFRAQFSDGAQSGLLTSTLSVALHHPLDVAFDVTPLYAHHTDGPPPIIVSEQFLICAEARANTEHPLQLLKAEIVPVRISHFLFFFFFFSFWSAIWAIASSKFLPPHMILVPLSYF